MSIPVHWAVFVCCSVTVIQVTNPEVDDSEAEIPAVVIEVPQEDFALMEELRRKVESLPADLQEREALQIFLDNVDRFKSEHMRNRVYLSIGQLYRRFGDNDKALSYFKMAGVPEDGTGNPNRIGAISRGHTLNLLEEKGDLSSVIQHALQYRDDPAVTDHEFAALTYKAGRALILSGDTDGGVELGIAAASERPCRDTFAKLETLAADADRQMPGGNSDAGLEAMHWLHSNSGSFGQSWRFLSNLAYCEEVHGNISAAIDVLEELVMRHPESDDAAYSLLQLSSFSMEAGDKVASRAYLTQVIDGNGPAEVQERARDILQLMDAQQPPPVSVPPPENGSLFRMFLISHVVLFGGIAAVWWRVKRRPGKT